MNVADITNDEANIATLQVSTGIIINTTLTMGSTTLSSDYDVPLSNLSNGQLLQYNSSLSKWNNISPTYISSCSINACTDATLTSLVINNLLMYNGLKGLTQVYHQR